MRWKSESWKSYYERIGQWHLRYAWFPRKIGDVRIWLEYYECRYLMRSADGEWLYREPIPYGPELPADWQLPKPPEPLPPSANTQGLIALEKQNA